jgi:hypothetical protein
MSTSTFTNFALAQIAELGNLQTAMDKAKSPADVARIRGEMYELVEGFREDGYYWARKELRAEARMNAASLRNNATLSPDGTKNLTTLVNRAVKSVDNTANDLKRWADNAEKESVASKTVGALRKEMNRINAKLEIGDFRNNKERLELENSLENYRRELKRLNKELEDKGIKALTNVGEPNVYYRAKGKKRGDPEKIKTKIVPATKHIKMMTDTYYNQAAAIAALDVAKQNGGWILVSDGPGCGWERHEDKQKANGMVLNANEEPVFISAHPGCARQIIPIDKPGTKKYREQMKRLTGVTTKRDLQRIAKAGAVVGLAVNAVAITGKNPFVREVTQRILNDVDMDIPSLMRRALTAWSGNYLKKEAAAMAFSGSTETAQQFRSRVAAGIDSHFGNIEFLDAPRAARFDVPEEMSRVMRLKKNPTKADILEGIENYGTWIVHQGAAEANLYDNLVTEQIFSEARERLYGEAAINFHMSRKPGQAVMDNWSRTAYHLKSVIDSDPDRATLELVRAAAAVLDPLPWLGARMGQWRFTAGFSSRGRQDLAQALYERMRGQPAFSDTEIEWAKRLGITLGPRSITQRDIINALIPRVTYLGKPFSATVSLENGKLVPVLRFMPENEGFRWLKMQARLRSQSMDEIMEDMRVLYYSFTGTNTDRKIALQYLLKRADDELIFTIDAFRNGPIRASLRFDGLHEQAFGIKLRPDRANLRFNYGLYRHNTEVKVNGVVRNVAKMDHTYDVGVAPIRGLYLHTSGPYIEDLNEYDIGNLRLLAEERGVSATLPGGKFKLREQLEDELRTIDFSTVIARLWLWRGNLSEVAVQTGISYEHLLRTLHHDLKNYAAGFARSVGAEYAKIETFVKLAKEYSLGTVRNLEDLENKLREIRFASNGSRQSWVARDAIGKGFDPDLLNPAVVDPDIVGLDNQTLNQDISDTLRLWKRSFGESSLPFFRLADENERLSAMLVYRPDEGAIVVSRQTATTWANHSRMRAKAVAIGHFPQGTQSAAASLVHEATHDLLSRLTKSEREDMWQAVFASHNSWDVKPPVIPTTTSPRGQVRDHALFERQLHRWFSEKKTILNISYRLGAHGVYTPDEFLADALSEYMTSPSESVRPIAEAVGEFLESVARGRVLRRRPNLRSV